MKIKCLIIGKDRYITEVNVDSRKANFSYNEGLYIIPSGAVNLAEFADGKKEPYPELVYHENDPMPVNVKNAGSMAEFLDKEVVANAIKQISEPKSEFFTIISDYVRNPNKLFLAVFALIILLAFLGSWLMP